jgi:hypothetical protein
MEIDMSRALRRHHRARLKKARQNYHSSPYMRAQGWSNGPAAIASYVDTPTPCSCWMCGNPRRYRNGPRLTMQERRALLRASYDE